MAFLKDGLSRSLHFAWWWEPGGDGEPLSAQDPALAKAILARVARSGDAGALRALLFRANAQPLFGSDDAAVLEELSRALVGGRLRVWEMTAASLSSFGDVEEEAPAVAPVESSAPVVAEPVVGEEATFSGSADAEAMAQVLIGAAESGVPFCEECQKLADAEKEAA